MRFLSSSRLGILWISITLSACSFTPNTYEVTGESSWLDRLPFVYQPIVVQGNIITQEQRQALRIGMNKTQVREILGQALVQSIFHDQRWDYVFTYKRGREQAKARKLSAFFKADVLERIETDDLPTEQEFADQFDAKRKLGKPPLLKATEQQLRSFADSNAKANSAAQASEAIAQPPVARNYPPLENL